LYSFRYFALHLLEFCFTCSGFYRFNVYRLLGLIPEKSREARKKERERERRTIFGKRLEGPDNLLK